MNKFILLLELALLLVWCSLPGASAGFWKPNSTQGTNSVELGRDVGGSSGSRSINSRGSGGGARARVSSISKHRTAASTVLGDEGSTGGSTIERESSVLSLPVLHNLKYTVPYSFEECVEDLRQILTTLLADVSDLGKAEAKAKVEAKTDGKFDYRLSEFATQAIELCSSESHDTILDNLQSELGSGKYPQTCVVVVDLAQAKQPVATDLETDCFELLVRIEKQLKNKYLFKEKLLSTEKDRLKAVPKQARLQNNRSPPLVRGVKKANRVGHQQGKGATLLIFNGHQTRGAETETDLGYATTTLLKALFGVTNNPTVIHSTVTKTESSKSLGTVTTTRRQTNVSTSTTLVKSIASMTDLLVKDSMTTETAGKQSSMQWETVTTTKAVPHPYFETDLPILKQDYPQVEAEYIPGRRTLTIETTMTTLITTTSRLMLVSRICHAVTRFGITCPTIPIPTTSKSSSSSNKSGVSHTTTTITATDTTTSTSSTITTKTKTKTTAQTTTKTMTATKWEEKEPCDDDDHSDYPHHHPLPPKDDDDHDCDDDYYDDYYDDDDDYYYFQDRHDFVEKYAVELALPKANTISHPHMNSVYNNTKIKAASLDSDDAFSQNGNFSQFRNYSETYESVENKSAHFLSSLFLNALFALLILVIIL